MSVLKHQCPHCDGTGIEKMEPLPFEEFPDDSDISIRAAKGIVNCLYKWKNRITDASGNEYKAEDHVDSLSRAVSILEEKGVLTAKQVGAIITYLMNDK